MNIPLISVCWFTAFRVAGTARGVSSTEVGDGLLALVFKTTARGSPCVALSPRVCRDPGVSKLLAFLSLSYDFV